MDNQQGFPGGAPSETANAHLKRDDGTVHSLINITKVRVVKYGFNKSHAVSYALLAFQTGYLKTHYTVEYFTALLTVFGDDKEKVAGYVQDARQYGIQVIKPDINLSEENFTVVDDKTIRYGLNGIKGFPELAVKHIPTHRPYRNLQELIEKNEKRNLNKAGVDKLVWSGAVDSLSGEINRLETLKLLYQFRGDGKRIDDMPQEMPARSVLEQEKEVLGIYLSGHPLDGIAKPIDWENAESDERLIEGLAMVNRHHKITTKKGDPMSFADLEFVERHVDAVIFPNVYSKDCEFRKGDKLVPIGELIEEDMVVKVKGRYQENFRGEQSFIVQSIDLPVRANEAFHERIRAIQEEKGSEPLAPPPPVQAPQFTMNIPN